MRIIKNAVFALLFLFGITFLNSCGKDSGSINLDGQLRLIQSYVTTNGLTDSVTKVGDLWYYRFQKGSGVKIQNGDKVSLQYVLNVINSSTYLFPYTTNIYSVAKQNNLDTAFTKFEPLTITVGKSGLFKGFDVGLSYLYDGDAALILFPSTYGYGEETMGVVPSNSPLAVRVYVKKVE